MNNPFKGFSRKMARIGATVTAGASALVAFGSANAAIDVAGVTTALTTTEQSAQSVGTVVIGIVASLVVVGVVIGLVKKL